MSNRPNTETLVYGQVHNLQSIAVTASAPRKDGYWVMYASESPTECYSQGND